jgi:hypothetical protein
VRRGESRRISPSMRYDLVYICSFSILIVRSVVAPHFSQVYVTSLRSGADGRGLGLSGVIGSLQPGQVTIGY